MRWLFTGLLFFGFALSAGCDEERPIGLGSCADAEPRSFSGSVACSPLPTNEQHIVDRLSTVWRQQPKRLCRFDPAGQPRGPCGAVPPHGAFYCGLDDSISWSQTLVAAQEHDFGDFAVVTVLAHEWGHANQLHLELLEGPATKDQELHADCQAGMFAAVEQAVGHIEPGDLAESFASLCAAGDPAQAQTHGTCEERSGAFKHGYEQSRLRLPLVCGTAPLEIMKEICGF